MQPVLPVHIVARILLVLLLAAGVYFFSGFVVPVLAALIVGFASWPIYSRWVNICGGRTTLAASGALIFITLVLIVPISAALCLLMKAGQHGPTLPSCLCAGHAWRPLTCAPAGIQPPVAQPLRARLAAVLLHRPLAGAVP
jgi:hypothetical protein